MRRLILEPQDEDNRVEITIEGLGYIIIQRDDDDIGTIVDFYKQPKPNDECIHLEAFQVWDDDMLPLEDEYVCHSTEHEIFSAMQEGTDGG